MSDKERNKIGRRKFLSVVPLTAISTPLMQRALSDKVTENVAPTPPPIFPVSLSACSWIDAQETTPVTGVRLRWAFNSKNPTHDKYLDLPGIAVLERAVVSEPAEKLSGIEVGNLPSMRVPESWWDNGLIQQEVFPTTFTRLDRKPCQAVMFRYEGPDAVLVIRDIDDTIIDTFNITGGKKFYFEHPEIVSVQFPFINASQIKLRNTRTLNLFQADRQLAFTEIAAVNMRQIISGRDIPVDRLNGFTSVSSAGWADYTDIAKAAYAAMVPGKPFDPSASLDPRELFALWHAAKWEYAVLAGWGFLDGPRNKEIISDQINKANLLATAPTSLLAYRIRLRSDLKEPSEKAQVSNIAVVNAGKAPKLNPPSAFSITLGHVTLKDSLDPDAGTDSQAYFGKCLLSWTNTLPAAGIELLEQISSTHKGTAETTSERYYNVKSDLTATGGEIKRKIELPYADATLEAEVRSFDHWDRVSDKVNGGKHKFRLKYDPPPPEIENCSITDSTATFLLNDWVPDELLLLLTPRVKFYKRISKPARIDVTTSLSVVTAKQIRMVVSGVTTAELLQFVGGRLKFGNFISEIEGVIGTEVILAAYDPGDEEYDSQLRLVAGNATLLQHPMHTTLWSTIPVAECTVYPLPRRVDFPAPPPTGVMQVFEYAARLTFTDFAGTLMQGPLGNPVPLMIYPVVPSTPPPFTIDLLGVDFYKRISVKLTFTGTPPTGNVVAAWAQGRVTDFTATNLFAAAAMEGNIGNQKVMNGSVFEIFDLPPLISGTHLTFGIAQVNDGLQKGAYAIAEAVI